MIEKIIEKDKEILFSKKESIFQGISTKNYVFNNKSLYDNNKHNEKTQYANELPLIPFRWCFDCY